MVPKRPEELQAHMLRTYVWLRRVIIVVTLLFLAALCWYRLYGRDTDARHSISAYYHHTNADVRMKDVFVAALCTVGVLLVCYQGYTRRENWALDLAGVALVCVVAFPMDWPPGPPGERGSAVEAVHYVSALTFFGCIGYVCLYRAHDTLDAVSSEARKARYRNLYRVTGVLMVATPVLAIALYFLRYEGWVYLIEYVGVCVFLAYWVIKSVELELTGVETRSRLRAVTTEAPGRSGTEPVR